MILGSGHQPSGFQSEGYGQYLGLDVVGLPHNVISATSTGQNSADVVVLVAYATTAPPALRVISHELCAVVSEHVSRLV
jgi:hypothetical protein